MSSVGDHTDGELESEVLQLIWEKLVLGRHGKMIRFGPRKCILMFMHIAHMHA
jgi:hypothetical protein